MKFSNGVYEKGNPMSEDAYLPICLNLKSFRILIVGAGRVALQKLKTLLKFDCNITVVSTEACKAIINLAHEKEITLFLTEFSERLLNGYNLVYACTDDPRLNEDIARMAQKRSVLCNISSNRSLSNFISPAVYKKGKLLLAVSTSGQSPKTAVKIRDELKKVIADKRLKFNR